MSVPEEAVAEARAYLRIDGAAEDELLAMLVGAAIGLCERFTGLTLLAADRGEAIAAGAGWLRLPATPVFAITSVEALDAGGAAVSLPVGGYAIDIDAAGDGWVKLDGPAEERRLFVEYHAGLAADWRSLPEPLRQGMVRLVAHLHAHRDVMADSGPPAVVAALWRPWRRMRLA